MAKDKVAVIIDKNNIIGRMERIPWSTFLLVVMLVGSSAVFFDIFDIDTAGSILPVLAKIYLLTGLEKGLTLSMVFFGMFIGSWVSGYLADKLGRKRLFNITIILMSVGSLLSALSINIYMFWSTRLITGFGIGGDFPVVWVYVNELIPTRYRGRLTSATYVIGVASIPAISFLAAGSIAILGYNIGWRVPFIVGAIIGLIIYFVRKLVPESPRWYLAHNMLDKAEETMKQIEEWVSKSIRRPLPPPPNLNAVINLEKTPMRDAFKPGIRVKTILVILTFITGIAAFYGFVAYLPTILVEKGFTIVKSITYAGIGYIGGILGPTIPMIIGERFQRRYQLLIYLPLLAIIIPIFAFSRTVIELLILAFIINLLLQAQAVTFEYYTPEVFPTKVRGTAIGIANGLGRLYNALSLIIIGALIVGVVNQLLYVSILLLIMALCIYLIRENTSGKVLEDISEKKMVSQ